MHEWKCEREGFPMQSTRYWDDGSTIWITQQPISFNIKDQVVMNIPFNGTTFLSIRNKFLSQKKKSPQWRWYSSWPAYSDYNIVSVCV